MKKLLITNVVYGELYSSIFLNYHLKSLLDESNIPACKDRIEYSIYTDDDTMPVIQTHPNYGRLCETIGVENVRFYKFGWPGNANRFGERYAVLIGTFRMGVREALERDVYLSAIVSDLVYAQHAIPRIIRRLDEGYDSVFMLPARSAYEAMKDELDKYEGAPCDFELWDMCYRNLHPLWCACHWDAAQFTKLPFSLLWNNGKGILARSFSITPIAFQPTHEMISACQVIDVEIPSTCKNPFWCTDWTDCPVIGVEPITCYYPPFANHKATTEWVKDWTKRTLHPSQMSYLSKTLHYPCKEALSRGDDIQTYSDSVVDSLQR